MIILMTMFKYGAVSRKAGCLTVKQNWAWDGRGVAETGMRMPPGNKDDGRVGEGGGARPQGIEVNHTMQKCCSPPGEMVRV